MRAVSAEFVKLFTTRLWWLLALTLLVYLVVLAGGLGALFGWAATDASTAGATGITPLPPGLAPHALIYSLATSVGYVFPVILGALAVTGEVRHQTLTPTFLATPRRGRVLAAKIVTLFIAGLALGLLGWLATMGAGAAALGGFGQETALGSADTWSMAARGVLAMALWCAVGVGIGTLIPNQMVAIIVVIVFTQFVEPLLRFAAVFTDVTAGLARFLPGAASDALVGASFYAVANPAGTVDPLLWWQGGLILFGIAVVATVAGGLTTWRRDVS